MKVLALFVWMIVPLGLCAAVVTWGTPHVALSYTFYDNGRRFDPLAHREYIICTWWGWSGRTRLPAQNGHCPWVRLLKAAP